ncbi:hypothetical protein AciX8_4514 [Granulicella mallensis MP5ACTX8]|uniref:Uncharacterized protein n=1 Tax=Granulicella mallensis (strain ATCC BAA-1857 / DSM 23137 / MP5ACTX8) TaxID=682795 RepID=G8NV15_GRAMM|nr:hypothetical protein AciX8_4514 [Granulicella mallensis MP5ACTX8]
MFSGKIKNAQGPLNGNIAPRCFNPRCFVIDEQRIGIKLFGQCNRLALSQAKTGWKDWQRQARGSNRNPLWKLFHPYANRLWGIWLCEFADYSRRNNDTAIQNIQQACFFNEHKVTQRTGIGDDNHRLRYPRNVPGSSSRCFQSLLPVSNSR